VIQHIDSRHKLRPSGPEVLFKTCVAMKFVDDDDKLLFPH